MIYLLGWGKILPSNRIIISRVGINNNSPRISKRSFHSTNHLRFDFIIEMLNVMGLENMLVIITDAKVSLLAQDFSNPSITKAVARSRAYYAPLVNFLLSDTKIGTMTHAKFWNFDPSVFEGHRIQSEDVLKEFQKLETLMKNNLDNTKHAYYLAKGGITGEAAHLSIMTNWKSSKFYLGRRPGFPLPAVLLGGGGGAEGGDASS